MKSILSAERLGIPTDATRHHSCLHGHFLNQHFKMPSINVFPLIFKPRKRKTYYYMSAAAFELRTNCGKSVLLLATLQTYLNSKKSVMNLGN